MKNYFIAVFYLLMTPKVMRLYLLTATYTKTNGINMNTNLG